MNISALTRVAKLALGIAALSGVAGCKSRPQTHASPSAPATTVRVADEAQPKKHRGFGKAAVYIDGKAAGVLVRNEMPPSVPVHLVRRQNGRDYPKFWLTEYLTALGASIDSIKEIHFYGGRAVTIMSGDELRRLGNKTWFSYTKGTSGKPRMEWPDEHIEVNTTIDMIGAIAVYQEKKPPTLLPDFSLALDDGRPIEGIPYAPPEQAIKGTRVYVDGALLGAMKRKTLPSSIQRAGTDASPRFSVTAYLESIGFDIKAMKAIDFVSTDDTIARFDAKSLESLADKMDFAIARHRQGVMLVSFPKNAAGPGPWPVVQSVTAIVAYKNVKPPVRELVATSSDEEDPSAQAVQDNGGAEEGSE